MIKTNNHCRVAVNVNVKVNLSFLRFFRTPSNKKFLNSTLDQLIQPGVVEKLNGYIGRETAKAFTATDNYIGDVHLIDLTIS